MDNIDWEDLPRWLTPILVLAYFLRSHLQRGYEFLFKSASGKQEHKQELEETELNALLQDRVSQSLRQRELDNQALEILRESIGWSRQEFSDMERKIQNIQHGINRNNDLFTLHNQMISHLIEETRELLKSIKEDD